MPIRYGDEVEHPGLVVTRVSDQHWPSEDVDYYAVVWDEQKGHPTEIWIGTNSHGTTRPIICEVDATPEVKAKYSAWVEKNGCRSVTELSKRLDEERKKEVERLEEMRIRAERDSQNRTLVTTRRYETGKCIYCGNPLSLIDKLFGRASHRSCSDETAVY